MEIDCLAKDSVPYHTTVEVPANVYNELQRLMKKKGPEDQIFSIDAGKVSSFLKDVDKAFSPKLYRTAIAAATLVEYLKAHRISKDAPEFEKVALFKMANLEVSKKLNHQHGIGKSHEANLTKFDDKITAAKTQLKTAKTEAKANPKKLAKVDRLTQQIAKLESSRELKEATSTVSLSTALGSYIDPRIVFSYCKDVGLEPTKLYNKKQAEFFGQWAGGTPANFWRKYP